MADRENNPIDEALAAKEKLAQDRRVEDQKMWETWKENPTTANIRPIMDRFEPVFKQKVRRWKAPNVNESAFRAHLKIQTIGALKTFDPSNAALRTHLEHRLQKAKRFNVKHQNMAYIPEAPAGHIGRIKGAFDELHEEYGREPTGVEIADFLNPGLPKRRKLTGAKVQRIITDQRKDIIGSTFESDPVPHAVSRERHVIGLLRPTLSTDQQQVFDYLYGVNGKPLINSTTQLAKVLGKRPDAIARLRTGILNKYKEYA